MGLIFWLFIFFYFPATSCPRWTTVGSMGILLSKVWFPCTGPIPSPFQKRPFEGLEVAPWDKKALETLGGQVVVGNPMRAGAFYGWSLSVARNPGLLQSWIWCPRNSGYQGSTMDAPAWHWFKGAWVSYEAIGGGSMVLEFKVGSAKTTPMVAFVGCGPTSSWPTSCWSGWHWPGVVVAPGWWEMAEWVGVHHRLR